MTVPRSGSLVGKGAGTAVPSAPRDFIPYVYRGNRPWVPEGEPSRRTAGGAAGGPEQAAERRAEFARLRAAGRGVYAAGAAVGIAPDTAVKYERRRRREAEGTR